MDMASDEWNMGAVNDATGLKEKGGKRKRGKGVKSEGRKGERITLGKGEN